MNAGGQQSVLVLRQQRLQALGILELAELVEREYGLPQQGGGHGRRLIQPVLVRAIEHLLALEQFAEGDLHPGLADLLEHRVVELRHHQGIADP
ncbi:hypothetical protein D3C80_1919260 [compost metagenome]